MIREVDLVSYLPPFMQSYKEPVAALEAENPEFSLMWSATDRCLRNRLRSLPMKQFPLWKMRVLWVYHSRQSSPRLLIFYRKRQKVRVNNYG